MWLDLRTGYRCNNRCRFCDQVGRVGEAPLDALVAVLRAYRGEGVWLAGGEVTLRPDLPKLVAAAREAGYRRVGLQTNGRILAAAGAAASLRKAGLTDAIVALHGATADVHELLTREPGSFRQAVVGARRLREAGVATRVATVVTRTSTDTLPDIARLAIEVGAEGHRWHVARPTGPDDRMLVPRFALIQRPLAEALDAARDARIEADTAGVPLCFLPGRLAAAADRLDGPPAARAFPPGLEEAPVERRKGPPCAACPLAHACAGPTAAYVARYGWDEFVAPGSAPLAPPDPAVLVVAPDDTTRVLRQRLVRLATARTLVFAGESPWRHPALPAIVRDAVRIGIPRVEVWGPLLPLDPPALDKLEGLARVRVPRLADDGAQDAIAAGLAERGCEVEWVDAATEADPADPR